ncbi:MAG: TlpA family protein disulfide reductase [Akkermansiaceae bacterium]|nr:TlpA family protein disulfide reductase [Akkermansiaceae bacterium]
MNLSIRKHLLLPMIAATACLATADAAPKHHLSDFKPGELVSGPSVDFTKMAGKVVVIDYWGVHCPPCLALMPHVAKLHKRYADDGLVLVAAESQGSPVAAIKKVVKKHRLACTVTKFIQGPKLSKGIPYMAVFDVEGKMVYAGYPGSAADRVIAKELKRATPGAAPAADAPATDAAAGPLVKHRTWTNSDGRAMSAELISLSGNMGTFRKIGGAPFTYDITQLSEEDQKLIRAAGTH